MTNMNQFKGNQPGSNVRGVRGQSGYTETYCGMAPDLDLDTDPSPSESEDEAPEDGG